MPAATHFTPQRHLDIDEARALALRAQAIGEPQQLSGVTPRVVRSLLQRMGALQIDSVNVLVRSHYLPVFSRAGKYERALLDRIVYARPRRFFEYWGHEASYLPIELYPAFRWRMRQARDGVAVWRNVATVGREQPKLLERVLQAIRERGPLAASDFDDAKQVESWWGWSNTKRALEFLFWCGEISAVARRSSFERVYDLTDRVIPRTVLDVQLDDDAAYDALIETAARAYGIATENDLRDYFRLPIVAARQSVARLVERGRLLPATVESWKKVAFVHAAARIPRAVPRASALISPFDPLVWNRERIERLFDFHYRIEIYTPAHKRVHGYYVLPYLLDGRLVARVDAKADRSASALLVHAVHFERGVNKALVRARLREDLASMAAWLSLRTVRASM